MIYFKEIKSRIFLSLTTWVSCCVISLSYKDNLTYLITKPYVNLQQENFYFIFTEISEPFYTNIYFVTFISNQIVYIVLIYNMIMFVKPGLYLKEYSSVKIISIYYIFFNILFIKIFYNLITPYSFSFFYFFQKDQKVNFFFEAKINECVEIILSYYSLSTIITLTITILFFIKKLYNKNFKYFLLVYRKYIMVSVIYITILLTPPDIVNQFILIYITIILIEIYNYFIIFYEKSSNNTLI